VFFLCVRKFTFNDDLGAKCDPKELVKRGSNFYWKDKEFSLDVCQVEVPIEISSCNWHLGQVPYSLFAFISFSTMEILVTPILLFLGENH
jgi:hypothetical protein